MHPDFPTFSNFLAAVWPVFAVGVAFGVAITAAALLTRRTPEPPRRRRRLARPRLTVQAPAAKW